MLSRAVNALRFLVCCAVLARASCLYAAEIPEEVQLLVKSKTDAQHTLMPPIINADPAMPGTYVYFLENTGNEPGYSKDNRPYMIDAHLLFADAAHHWHDVPFDRYLEDGGIPQIASVFFANADHDPKDKELVVLVQTPQRHYDYGGDFYDGYIYKLTGSASTGAVFVGLQSDASEPFIGQCECGFRDGRVEHARYADAASIRKALAAKYGNRAAAR
ncbi:hypothetical protein GQ57_01580 [Burkholderia sp. MSh2]|nr:hypothetical protein GQ57_01580 [Burkholderia sp. MSh2]